MKYKGKLGILPGKIPLRYRIQMLESKEPFILAEKHIITLKTLDQFHGRGEIAMMLGPHTERRNIGNHPVFQTNYWNPKSLTPPSMVPETDENCIWHAAYVASVTPKASNEEGTRYYLNTMTEHAEVVGVDQLIVHTGKVVGVYYNEYIKNVIRFLASLDDASKIVIELGASVNQINTNPRLVASRFPWCLDIAHAWGAGVYHHELLRTIDEYPPKVCHANFPGSKFCSSRDVHGWRSADNLDQDIVNKYDEIIRRLHVMEVPLIIEGSGFTSSNMTRELECVKEILND